MVAAVAGIPLQRWLALTLIVLEAISVAYLSKTAFFPGVIICVAVFGTFSQVRFAMDRQRTYDIIALMAVVFVIKYMLTPDNPRYVTLFPSQQIAFAVAQYVLAMQCVQFYLRRRDDRLPISFPGIGVISLVCASMLSINSGERSTIQALCVGFAIVAVLYCDSSRTFVRVVPERRFGRPVATMLVLLAVGSLGWFSASSMFRYERHVEEFVNRFLQQQTEHSSVGFSESSALGSVSLKKTAESKSTALRVVAAVEPGYFRARVYDVYENHKWLLNTEGRALSPQAVSTSQLRSVTHRGRAFQIADAANQSTQQFEVWPDAELPDTFAGPLGTSWLYADARVVTVDTHDIMRSSDAASGVPYTLVVLDSATRLASKQHVQDRNNSQHASDSVLDFEQLSTPPDWATSNERIVKLARAVFEGCNSVHDKVEAVQRYFHLNYSYSLQITLPPGSGSAEPLEWFLEEKPAAHCEYFASGAAVLLRMAGVPCRYVVGFVVSEQNRYSGEWVARNEDAHAWVEACDESQAWITVEATPAAGVPDDSTGTRWAQFYEYLRDEFHRLRIGWQQQGFSSIGKTLSSLIVSPIGSGVVGVSLLSGLTIVLWRKRRHSVSGRNIYEMPSPVVEPIQAARAKLDRALRKAWRVRSPGETVKVYARRLAAEAINDHDPLTLAAAWYEQYSRLRFTRHPDAVQVSRMTAEAEQLLGELRRRGKHAERAKQTE
ncbi:MAG: transglutaminase-like domain-containing protein [Planctomycetota bacterium]|nr:transglutaminase-like domain-containing protein [Planctomycetota bacterium]